MINRAGLFPIICVVAMLLAPVLGRAANEPAATAAIPPPAPPVAVHKPSPPATAHKSSPPAAKPTAVSRAKAHHTRSAKMNIPTAAQAAAARKPERVAQRHARHRATERRSVVVHSAPPPPPPAHLPRDYAGVPLLGPDGPPPPLPPPWYDRTRPAIAFAYPPPFMGRRGPMPPWWGR